MINLLKLGLSENDVYNMAMLRSFRQRFCIVSVAATNVNRSP